MDVHSFYKKKAEGPVSSASADNNESVGARGHGSRSLGLLQPETVWRVFPRQQMAFDFAKTCWQSVAVFSYECEKFGREGQRKFLVTTYYNFGQHYLAMKSPRHYYEVITEGSACHLYFDIEFKFEHNPQVEDAIQLLETFIRYVCNQLSVEFAVCCDRSNILDLDSTTDRKFSRHLIFHIPKAVFRTNLHAGDFVHCICDKLRAFKHHLESGLSMPAAYKQLVGSLHHSSAISCPTGEELLALFVLTDKEKPILICDEGVYTKNRNFRVFLSSKLGKEARLCVARENRFRSAYGEELQRQRRSKRFNTLIDSLVSNVRVESAVRILGCDIRTHQKQSASEKSTGTPFEDSATSEEGFSQSPYPSVDQFITSQLSKGGVQGAIRRWTFFPQGKCLVYDIQHNRWCERIGRAHKSNNIMIVADLVAGSYYQKCHDPECKRANFRSNEYPIPASCNPVASSSALLHTDTTDVGSVPSQQEQGHVEGTPSAADLLVGELVGEITADEIRELELDASGSWEDWDHTESVVVPAREQCVEAITGSREADSQCDEDEQYDSLLNQALTEYETSVIASSNPLEST